MTSRAHRVRRAEPAGQAVPAVRSGGYPLQRSERLHTDHLRRGSAESLKPRCRPSEGQTVRSDTDEQPTTTTGGPRRSTDPWDIETAYDYNDAGAADLPNALPRPAAPPAARWAGAYYPNGKLKEKTDDGVPVGTAVTARRQLRRPERRLHRHMDARAASLGQQGYTIGIHAAGSGTDAFTWTLNIPKDGKYTAYVKFPQVSGSSTDAKYTITHAPADAPTRPSTSPPAAGALGEPGTVHLHPGRPAKLELFQARRRGRRRRRQAGARQLRRHRHEKHHFRYAYDLNGNLKSIDDLSSGAKVDAYDHRVHGAGPGPAVHRVLGRPGEDDHLLHLRRRQPAGDRHPSRSVLQVHLRPQ